MSPVPGLLPGAAFRRLMLLEPTPQYPSLLLDATDDLITVNDYAGIQNLFAGGGTIEIWIYPRSDGQADLARIFHKISTNGWQIFASGESGGKIKLTFTHTFSGDDGTWILTNAVVQTNRWTHLAIAYDNADVANNPIFYLDGVAFTVGSGLTESSTPTLTAGGDAAVNVTIGNVSGATRTWDGGLAEPRFWGDIRTQAELNRDMGFFLVGDETDLVGYWPTVRGAGTTLTNLVSGGNAGTITGATWEYRKDGPKVR